jgi:Zn-finger nucleic acid-binding protein
VTDPPEVLTEVAVNCPRCAVPLSISDRQGIEIDFCPQCRGVWMDRGELDKVVERAAAFARPEFGGRDDDDDDDDNRRRGSYPPAQGHPGHWQPGYSQPPHG